MIAWIVLYIAASYLVGAVPFGYLAGRIRGLDLRREGSCNIGATNAWRVLGWKWGLSVFALDFLKGFVPVFGALNWLPFLTGDAGGWDFNAVVVLVCFAVVLGHTYTCFLGFRGGKGVRRLRASCLPSTRWWPAWPWARGWYSWESPASCRWPAWWLPWR